MLLRGILRIMRQTASTKQCLKILQLTIPTTKSQIKKKYLLMAKKYHPDSIQLNKKSSQTDKINQKVIEITKMKKQLQQKFVTINQAYQYLKQLSQEEINSLKNQASDKTQQSNQGGKNQRQRRMSTQQIKRQQSYQYFNRKFKEDISGLADQNTFQREKKPLFKLVPELFIGFLLLAVMLGDVTYRIMKRDQNMRAQEQKIQRNKRMQQKKFTNAFRSMNHESFFNRKFNKIQKIE